MQGQLLHDVKVVAPEGRVNIEMPPERGPMPKAPSGDGHSRWRMQIPAWMIARTLYLEEHGMSEIQIVKVDQGGVNARILAKEAKADLRRVEAASRDIDLEGRAFLHSYDWRQDEDGSALHAIMTAPMVVAQWINSQYLFSTVNNARFGAGDKSTHNVIGGFGVMQGNGGDLCVGLPRQSLFNDDGAPFHIPQRLLVLVHAPLERVDRIVTETPLLTRLFGNGWLRLVVIDPNDNSAHRWIQGETIMLSDAAVGGWSPNHYAL